MKTDEDDGQRRIMACYGAHPYALFLSIEEEIRDCLKTLVQGRRKQFRSGKAKTFVYNIIMLVGKATKC